MQSKVLVGYCSRFGNLGRNIAEALTNQLNFQEKTYLPFKYNADAINALKSELVSFAVILNKDNLAKELTGVKYKEIESVEEPQSGIWSLISLIVPSSEPNKDEKRLIESIKYITIGKGESPNMIDLCVNLPDLSSEEIRRTILVLKGKHLISASSFPYITPETINQGGAFIA